MVLDRTKYTVPDYLKKRANRDLGDKKISTVQKFEILTEVVRETIGYTQKNVTLKVKIGDQWTATPSGTPEFAVK